jgi:hypothetical protein
LACCQFDAAPELVRVVREMAFVALKHGCVRLEPVKGEAFSLRAISAELAEQGHLNERGRPFSPKSVGSCSRGERSSELGGTVPSRAHRVSVAVAGQAPFLRGGHDRSKCLQLV